MRSLSYVRCYVIRSVKWDEMLQCTFGERRIIARIVASRITATVSVKPDCWSIPLIQRNENPSHGSRTRLGQTFSTTIFLSSFSAYSERLSRSAIRVPRSGLGKSLISGPRIMMGYSSGETFFPKFRTKGTIIAAEAPPYSSAVRREGRIRKEANSGGNEEADSLSVLRSWSMNRSLAP